MLDIEVCDINNGVVFIPQEMIRLILVELYDVLVALAELEEILDKIVYLSFPSRVSFKIIDNFSVNNFVPAQVKYWAIKVESWLFSWKIPLLKVSLNEDFVTNIVNSFHANWSGSENWTYYDDATGLYKIGSDCTPPRGYSNADLVKDISHVMVIIAISYALIKCGGYLAKAGRALLSSYFTRKKHSDIMDNLLEIKDDVNLVSDKIEYVEDMVETNQALLEQISSAVGVKIRLL